MKYQTVVDVMVNMGDKLPSLAGNVVDIGVKKKWVTEQDIEIERALTAEIMKLPGKHSIFAEEEHAEFSVGQSIWVIDPISSTSSFINGIPTYSIVVAHLINGEASFAAIYDPSHKELFTAERGKGSYLNGQQIAVNGTIDEHLVITNPYIWHDYPKEEILAVVSNLLDFDPTIRNYGSLGLHYCYLACGRANVVVHAIKDTFPEFAGKLIVEEAGGKFTDWEGKDLLPSTRRILATNGKLHDQYLSKLKKL